jgi:hypothetical protein
MDKQCAALTNFPNIRQELFANHLKNEGLPLMRKLNLSCLFFWKTEGVKEDHLKCSMILYMGKTM